MTMISRLLAWGCVLGLPLGGAYLLGYGLHGQPWWAVLLGVLVVFDTGVVAGLVLAAALRGGADDPHPAAGYDDLDADDRRRLDLWLRR